MTKTEIVYGLLILVLVASAIGAALGAAMNLQEVVDSNNSDQGGEDDA